MVDRLLTHWFLTNMKKLTSRLYTFQHYLIVHLYL